MQSGVVNCYRYLIHTVSWIRFLARYGLNNDISRFLTTLWLAAPLTTERDISTVNNFAAFRDKKCFGLSSFHTVLFCSPRLNSSHNVSCLHPRFVTQRYAALGKIVCTCPRYLETNQNGDHFVPSATHFKMSLRDQQKQRSWARK